MVIVVMGEFETSCNEVARRLAESLGWELADVENLACTVQTGSPMTNSQPISQMEALSAAIYSLTCEWRDVIISCPTLPDKDQRRLHHNHPLVRFVYLTAPDNTHHSLLRDQPAGLTNSGMPGRRTGGTENDESVLSVDSSQGVEHILGAVLSTLILKRRTPNIPAA